MDALNFFDKCTMKHDAKMQEEKINISRFEQPIKTKKREQFCSRKKTDFLEKIFRIRSFICISHGFFFVFNFTRITKLEYIKF